MVEQDLLDLDDALEPRHRHAYAALVHRVVAEEAHHRVQLVQDLLEPELVGLVHHDEEHLVVGGSARLGAFRGLAREELVELQVLAVVHGLVGARHEADDKLDADAGLDRRGTGAGDGIPTPHRGVRWEGIGWGVDEGKGRRMKKASWIILFVVGLAILVVSLISARVAYGGDFPVGPAPIAALEGLVPGCGAGPAGRPRHRGRFRSGLWSVVDRGGARPLPPRGSLGLVEPARGDGGPRGDHPPPRAPPRPPGRCARRPHTARPGTARPRARPRTAAEGAVKTASLLLAWAMAAGALCRDASPEADRRSPHLRRPPAHPDREAGRPPGERVALGRLVRASRGASGRARSDPSRSRVRRPGDTLVVEVLKVRPNRDTAVSTQGGRFGSLVPDEGTAFLNEHVPARSLRLEAGPRRA